MNPYAIIVVLVLWAASLFGVGYEAYHLGQTSTLAKWQASDNAELISANQKIIQLETNARQQEHDKAIQLSTIATQYEQEKQHALKLKDDLIAQLRAGSDREQTRSSYRKGE